MLQLIHVLQCINVLQCTHVLQCVHLAWNGIKEIKDIIKPSIPAIAIICSVDRLNACCTSENSFESDVAKTPESSMSRVELS